MNESILAAFAFLTVLVGLLHYRMGRLPASLRALARKDALQEGGQLVDVMKEAVASRAGQALIAIQTYQEQLAQLARAQIAQAEVRAQLAERRASDTATALDAATALVRELRAMLDAAAEARAAPPASTPSKLRAAPPAPPSLAGEEPPERQTIKAPAPSASGLRLGVPRADVEDGGEFDDKDEMTTVADRAGALATLRGTTKAAR
jgi:hypothetical protein